MNTRQASEIVAAQCATWKLCRDNYAALASVESKTLVDSQGRVVTTLLHNPARIGSSAAPAPAERKCFLCRENRPAEQSAIDYGEYEILVNPFPIFPIHFTIAGRCHQPQSIIGSLHDMLGMSDLFPSQTVFYNGPRCGASAPDHHHFQAASFSLPQTCRAGEIVPTGHSIEISSTSDAVIEKHFDRLLSVLPEGDPEPMLNLLLDRLDDGRKRLTVIPRRRHRPTCYGEVIVSPAAVEMAGYMVTPRREDFEKIDAEMASKIINEVTYSHQEIIDLCNRL